MGATFASISSKPLCPNLLLLLLLLQSFTRYTRFILRLNLNEPSSHLTLRLTLVVLMMVHLAG